jgi:hypothetical protein
LNGGCRAQELAEERPSAFLSGVDFLTSNSRCPSGRQVIRIYPPDRTPGPRLKSVDLSRSLGQATGGAAVAVSLRRVVQWHGQCLLHESRFSGFSRTVPTGVQLRVPPVHLRGVRDRAFV